MFSSKEAETYRRDGVLFGTSTSRIIWAPFGAESTMRFRIEDPDQLLKAGVEDIVEYLIERSTVACPRLLSESRYQLETTDAQIDVSQDPRRDIRNRSKPST